MTRSRWMTGIGLALVLGGGTERLLASDHLADGLVEIVLKATERYRDPAEAETAGWASANACVSGPEQGAMGVHYIKGSILFDGKVDPAEPEALIYEVKRGRARLVGVEYIITAKEWHDQNGAAPPVIHGQVPNFVGSPNRYGLPPFYELHVWAWKSNPHGMFVDWNPAVSCAGFEPEPAPPAAAGGHAHGVR